MLPSEIRKYLDDQGGDSKEKVRNIKYMFMRDLNQQLSEINNMTVPEVLAYLKRIEEDAKKAKTLSKSKGKKTMG